MDPDLDPQTDPHEPDALDGSILLSIGDLMAGLLLFFALLFLTVLAQLRSYQDALDRLPLLVLQTLGDRLGHDGPDSAIAIDPATGDISIRDRILFDVGSADLTPSGQAFLNEFVPLYSNLAFGNPDIAPRLARIIIEGHTSSSGDDRANLDLSLRRAQAVANRIATAPPFPHQDQFIAALLTAGRGELDANRDRDDPRDRKVVFRFQFQRTDFTKPFQAPGQGTAIAPTPPPALTLKLSEDRQN